MNTHHQLFPPRPFLPLHAASVPQYLPITFLVYALGPSATLPQLSRVPLRTPFVYSRERTSLEIPRMDNVWSCRYVISKCIELCDGFGVLSARREMESATVQSFPCQAFPQLPSSSSSGLQQGYLQGE
ncbi:unnamed protein product [Somion occarium]|uniref:Uncharacterized protein n=1 Tax=Somion occarium TaxID=3059160 RepID=A0ABP1E712_9APHY